MSADGRLQSAYNAALAGATAALHASGYRSNPAAPGHHAVTVESIALTVGSDAAVVRKLDGFRRKRHRASYDVAGAVSEQEVTELVVLLVWLLNALAPAIGAALLFLALAPGPAVGLLLLAPLLRRERVS